MKQLSSVELRFLVRELNELVDKRVDKVYQLTEEDFIIQFQGKTILRIVLPSMIFLAEEKPAAPEKPTQFCMTLRKYLQNARIRKIYQVSSERILVMEFEKEEKAELIIELFSKGNLILTKDKKIISARLFHKWGNRTIRGGIEYVFPPAKANLFEITEEEFKKIIDSSNKESIVKTLATDLGLGGLFAEELCARTGIDKEKKSANASAIYKELKKLLKEELSPSIVMEEGSIKDAIPIELKGCSETKKTKTFSEAIYTMFLQDSKSQKKKTKDATFQKELEKLNRILETQKKTVEETALEIKEYESKAKYIYEHYQEISSILEVIKDLKKKKQLKGINNRFIKRIDEKEGKAVIEI
jgi:predicted ribosome quality control (RQC) complex YloA/Tae2 family protein